MFASISVNWGSVPEWLAAIGTILAVFAAIGIATKESRANRKKELVSQAECIAVWIANPKMKAYAVISNDSKLPIYDVLVSYGVAYGAGETYLTGNDDQIFIMRIPPGEWEVPEPRNHGGGMHIQLGLSISFRDSKGNYWRRDAKGLLMQTEFNPFREMGISEPISGWTIPIRINRKSK